MGYAIIELGGQQILVEEGVHFFTNSLNLPPGTKVSLNRLLLTNNNGVSKMGTPYLSESEVRGEVVEDLKGPKKFIYKMKSKKKYRRKNGHRQKLTKFLVTNIKY